MSPGTAKLSEAARHVIVPEGIISTGWPSVRDTCGQLGIGFDRWQDGAGRLILAKRADGLYAAVTVVMSIPRQVGKTYLIGAIVFALCVIFPGLTVLWTAHRTRTADEVFESMQGMAARKKMAPHVARVLLGSGKQAIKFRNGSRILFGARERGFGRGFAGVGVLVFDEGQILGEAALDDMIPATNAAPNPLVVMVGTPPKPSDAGEQFAQLRQEAIDGISDDVLYVELSADRGCDAADRDQWRKANASYPHRTSERAMLRMKKNLTPESFYREGLGIWDEINRQAAVVKAAAWALLRGGGPDGRIKPDGLAVDMSHAREISVAACWTMPDDHVHAEEVWAGVDTDACVKWVAARARRRIPVVIDSASQAAAMIPALKALRVKVIQTGPADMAKGCGLFAAKARKSRLSHGGQAPVNDALAAARQRPLGTAGGWVWDRTDDGVNTSPIVAVSQAILAASGVRQLGETGKAVIM